MSFVFVQEGNNSVVGPSSVNVPISPSGTGNLLVVTLFGGNTGGPVTPVVSDNVGNTYIQAPGGTTFVNNFDVSLWYAYNSIGGATSISVTVPGSSGVQASVQEFSGVPAGNPFVSANTTFNASGSPVGPILTPTGTQQLLIAFVGVNSAETAVSPWTGTSFTFGGDAYYINPPVSSQQATFTPNGAANYASTGAIFTLATTLILNLSDILSESDSMSDSFSVPLSDSSSSSDAAPNSFSVRSDFAVPIQTPVVETLVNQLIPSHVKTYFNIQE